MSHGQSGARQLVFDLPHRAAQGREDFLVSASNEQAVAMIDRWPDWLNPGLILIGPPGSGKTHLAEVWKGICGAQFCAAKDITLARLPQLAAKRRLIIEDLPGPFIDQTALFHLINLVRENSGYLLLTARSEPRSWPIDLKDLRSRISAMPVAVLREPDDFLLRGMLVKLFADRQIAVDEATIGYMVTHMERSAEFARHIVQTIDRRALEERAEITRSFVARIIQSRGD